MAFQKTTNKMKAIRAFINTWLKDSTLYCNNCGARFRDNVIDSCCLDPQIGRNKDHLMGVIKQNKMIQETRKNKFAAMEDNTMRWGISIAPKLMTDLENYFAVNFQEKLFNNNKELRQFMKAFPEFRIAKEI